MSYDDNTVFTYDGASKYLNIKTNTLYSLVRNRQIPHLRLGPRMVRFRKRDLDEWMRSNEVPLAGEASHS